MKAKGRYKPEFLVFIATAAIVAAYVFEPDMFERVGALPLGAAAIVAGYFSGLITFLVGGFYALLVFVVSLPLVSGAYGFVAYSISRAHYSLAGWLTGRFLARSETYQKVKLRVKSSRLYRWMSRVFWGSFSRAGVVERHPMKLMKVRRCVSCGREAPADGVFCPYCGSKR
jgi:hypothetical protein